MINFLSETHPELSKQWHPTKNGILTPFNTSYGSTLKVWWKCELGHEWQCWINNRARLNIGCPFCSNRKVWLTAK